MYTDRLLSYCDWSFGWTRNDYTHVATGQSTVCGDAVEYRLVVRGDVLETVDCEASGCCVAQCCAAMLAELARGKTLPWVQNLTPAAWDEYVGVPLPSARKASCLMLALRCLKRAVASPIQ